MNRAIVLSLLITATAAGQTYAAGYARIEAPVQTVDCASGSLLVLGLRVHLERVHDCRGLASGVFVEAIVNDDGDRLVATTVSICRNATHSVIDAPLQAIDRIAGTVTALGASIDARSAVVDGGAGLDSLRVGEIVEIIVRP